MPKTAMPLLVITADRASWLLLPIYLVWMMSLTEETYV